MAKKNSLRKKTYKKKRKSYRKTLKKSRKKSRKNLRGGTVRINKKEDIEKQPEPENQSQTPGIKDLPNEILSHIGQRISAGDSFRLGVALKNFNLMDQAKRFGEKYGRIRSYPADVTYDQYEKMKYAKYFAMREKRPTRFNNRGPYHAFNPPPIKAPPRHAARRRLPDMVSGVDGKKYERSDYKKMMDNKTLIPERMGSQ